MRSRMNGVSLVTGKACSAAALAMGILVVSASSSNARAQPPKDESTSTKVGLVVNERNAFQGYTLIAGLTSTKTYLIDMEGKVVRMWKHDSTPALGAYLLKNGNLLRATPFRDGKQMIRKSGSGGRLQEFTWDGKLVWDFKFSSDKQRPHHDICPMPNGNVLMVAWERKTAKEAVAAGRRPKTVKDGGLLPDCIIEVKRTGPTSGKVVWEWHLWDHLIQDHDKSKANHGDVKGHPELVDVNYPTGRGGPMFTRKDVDKLRGIGYVGRGAAAFTDWTHINAVDYNPKLDQIVLTTPIFGEIWIIDHSTTTAEAASHKGGRSGKGGDLLYRWGNPRTYRTGTVEDQKLFGPHGGLWVPPDRPGAGHIVVFNNGQKRPDGKYSSVDEIVLPVDDKGRYTWKAGKAFGPENAVWSYTAPNKSDFFAMVVSGAQRLANGNTLICSGTNGTVFEVTAKKELVWKYVSPAKSDSRPGGGAFAPPGSRISGLSEGVQLIPANMLPVLQLSAEQKKQLQEFQKEAGDKLDKILTKDQNKQYKTMRRGGASEFGGVAQPGQILTPFQQARLKLTAEQKKDLAELQKKANAALDKTLEKDQKVRLMRMTASFGPGGFGDRGIGSRSALFRTDRYAPDYPGLVGKELKGSKSIEELEKDEAKPKESK